MPSPGMFTPTRHALTFCPSCSLAGPSPISRCLPAPDAGGGQRCRRGGRPAMAARTPPAMPPPTPSTPTPRTPPPRRHRPPMPFCQRRFPMSNQPIPPAALRSRSSAATPSTATPFVAALANAATYPTLFRPAATDLVLCACNLACPVMIMKHTRWSGVVVALRVHLGSVAPCSIHSVSISLFCTSLPRSARFY